MSIRHHSKYPILLFAVFVLLLVFIILVNVRPKDATLEIFRGTLPCADCPGIDTTVYFYKDSKSSLGGVYKLKLVYLDRDVEPFIESGNWVVEESGDSMPVYSLYDGSRLSEKYLRIDYNTIKQIGIDGIPFDTDINFDLKRQ